MCILSKYYKYFVKHNDSKELSKLMINAINNYDAILNTTRNEHKKLKRFLVLSQVNKYIKFLKIVLNK